MAKSGSKYNGEIADDSVAVITWENDFGGGIDLPTRVGWQFPSHGEYIDPSLPIRKFRLRDEDNEIHYLGLLRDDDEAETQVRLADWGAQDTGGFIIEVKIDGRWEMIVG